MTEHRDTHVIFKNAQWMVQQCPGGEVHLVELLEGHPNDLEGGFTISAAHLATAAEDGHTELLHIAEKNWVDMDLFEAAARHAIAASGARPNYDLDNSFSEARRHHEGIYGRR